MHVCELISKATEKTPEFETLTESDKEAKSSSYFRGFECKTTQGDECLIGLSYESCEGQLPAIYLEPVVFGTIEPVFPVIDLDEQPNLSMAREWLRTCLEEHKHNSIVYQQYPTRLIDLGPLNQSQPPKLVLTNDDGWVKHDYTALSHCWGPDPIEGMTTTSTIAGYLNAIPHASLPRNFQDAMLVMRSLGYRYLWIDSMCIIQDSQDDWSNECTRMHLVYNNAVVTLAIADAPTANTGFLHRRTPRNDDLCVVALERGRTKDLDNVLIGLRCSPIRDQHWIDPDDLWVRQQEDFTHHLDSRAWTFQEAAMSSRILSFNDSQMRFLCETAECFECCRYPTHPLNSDEAMTRKFLQDLTSSSESDEKALVQDYSSIIEQYCRRFLTYGADKLPAISAIARKVQGVTGDEYLAGLWRRDLLTSLLWCCLDQPARHTACVTNRAPSWSWAASNVPIASGHVPGPRLEEVAEVLSVTVNTVTEDMFGQVHGGELKIRGWAIECGLGELVGPTVDTTRVHAHLLPEARGYFCKVRLDMAPHDRTPILGPVLCLLIAKHKHKKHDDMEYSDSGEWVGLIIQAVEGGQYYRRIGRCDNYDVYVDIEHPYQGARERVEQANPTKKLIVGVEVPQMLSQGPPRDFTLI